MTNLPAMAYPADDTFDFDFFTSRNVWFSVELLNLSVTSVPGQQGDCPSFFCWTEQDCLYLVDFMDGFSIPLSQSLSRAMQLLTSSPIDPIGLKIFWRDETKTWHTLSHEQVAQCLTETQPELIAA